jgi:hypothetical protein
MSQRFRKKPENQEKTDNHKAKEFRMTSCEHKQTKYDSDAMDLSQSSSETRVKLRSLPVPLVRLLSVSMRLDSEYKKLKTRRKNQLNVWEGSKKKRKGRGEDP